MPPGFYNSYMPFIQPHHIKTPSDIGVYLVSFNLHPGHYQPSGHLNVSRSREFYIKYDSTTASTAISSTNAVDMVASASALNFLLISDGSAVLRYST